MALMAEREVEKMFSRKASLPLMFVCFAFFVGLNFVTSSVVHNGRKALAGAELVLVEDGVSRAPIVIFADAPPKTRRAADELAEYIEKTSGARPEVIEGEPDPVPDRAIWVGYQPVLDDLFPGLDFDFKHAEDILIASNENHLVIAGRDRWDPDHLVVGDINGVQREYGTVNAVYTFLQDYLDVRWFWPGPFGEDVPRRNTIAFEPFEYRYHPQIRSRASLFRRSRLGGRGNAIEWSRFQRLQLDSLQIHAYHAYTDWWNRFHETNPEFFALQPDGTRTWSHPSRVKMCVSNPDFQKQWLKDAQEALEANPNREMFSASPNDGGRSGFCICENCLAWDHPDGKFVTLMWQGLSQSYFSLTDRYVTLANVLARRLRETYPDRQLYVGMYAYGAHRLPPVEAVPDDNVVIGVVANFHNRPSAYDLGDHRQDFLDWAKVTPNLLWRPNLAGHFRSGYLNVAPDDAIEDLRLAAESGVVAVDFDMLYEHWATQGPHYYMLTQMTWNPYADGEAILADYYRRAFGPAADIISAYWDFVEETVHPLIYEGQSIADTWDESFFQRANGHLDSALEVLDGEPEIFTERVGFVRAGLDYWDAMFEARKHMDRFRESGGQDKESEEKALTIWLERIRPLVLSETYPNAINSSYARPGAGRVSAYHPEHLDWRKAPWR